MGSKRIRPDEAVSLFLANGVQPLEAFQTSKKPWRSKCLKCGRDVQPSYSNVKNGHSACKFCAGLAKEPAEAEALLLRTFARPLVAYPGSKTPWLSVCLLCSREISPTLNVAVKSKLACNFCKRLSIDARQAVNIMLQSDLKPLEDYKSVHSRWRSECLRCLRITFPTFQKVRLRGHQCGWCARTRLDIREAKEILVSAGAIPIGEYPGANNRWRSKCATCDREIQPKVSVVALGGGACAYCGQRKVDPLEAESVMRKSGVEPTEPYPGARVPWLSRCLTCLRSVSPQYANVSTGHVPCVYCAKKRVDPQTAFELAISRGLEPLEPYPGSVVPWDMKCLKCSKQTSVTWVSLNQKREGAGCSSCTPFGFKPNIESYVYFISNEDREAFKIGISNLGSGRLAKHRKNGWVIMRLLKFELGSDAHDVEQKTLKYLRRDKKHQPAFFAGDGWTETFLDSDFDSEYLIDTAKSFATSSCEELSEESLTSKD